MDLGGASSKMKRIKRNFQHDCLCPEILIGDSREVDLLSKNLNMRIYKTVILPVVLYGCET
jgi:hypothetical protein